MRIEAGAAHVTLNRPTVHNAFDEAVIEQLARIWSELKARDDIHVLVLRGHGKNFCAGGDLNWMARAADYTPEQNERDARRLADMLHGLYALPQVTIARVQGAAMGGGLGLVACCDIAIADADAVFSLSEVKLGLIPATIGPYVLRAIGERQARRYFQTGERFDARRAQQIGLVHEVADKPEDGEYVLKDILKNAAANGPQAMRKAKRLCHDLAGRPLTEETIADTARRIAEIRSGQEAKERIRAFLEKRKI